MSQYRVNVRFMPGARFVLLRELNGFDEQSVGDTSTLTALRLLDRLIVAAPGVESAEGLADELTASDRDRLLAAVYRTAYGDRILSTVRCAQCGNLFDLSFSLEELERSLDAQRDDQAALPLGDGVFRLPDGSAEFRLPTGRDEAAITGLPPDEAERALWERCLVAGGERADREALQAVWEQIAPVLDLDLDAPCAECGFVQPVHFDIQSYLFGALLQERQRRATETDRLALAYNWGLNEILSLTRAERRVFVDLVEAEMSRRLRATG